MADLQQLYGFSFPDDLLQVWNLARRFRPLDPLRAWEDTLRIQLVGPFDVLAGRFDRHTPRYPISQHWRGATDPPELYTVLVGEGGLHWGYWLDDPGRTTPVVVAVYPDQDFAMTRYGDDLLTALHLHVQELAEEVPEEDLRSVRALFGPQQARARIGKKTQRDHKVMAPTLDGLGVVAPQGTYRPLSVTDRILARRIWRATPPAELIAEAGEACQAGFPATALKLGRDLWSVPNPAHYDAACELLEQAYAALGREVHRRVLTEHRQHREREWLDILEQEAHDRGAS